MNDHTRPAPKPIRTRRERDQDNTDQPIGYIPTKAALDYLAIRRQQHPRDENP